MNTCIICGKQYEPYYCYGKRQLTCSKECRRKYHIQYAENNPNKYIYAERSKIKAREKRNGSVICRICGKPVYRTFSADEGTPWMHYQCVIDDCVATVRAGEKLSKKQLSRLEQRGYSKTEFIEEFFNDKVYDTP